jgi:hypothetical protein
MILNCSGTCDANKRALKYCWDLCHNIYDGYLDDEPPPVKPTLDLCRDFCQALSDVVQTQDKATYNVLRASFEVNELYRADSESISEASQRGLLGSYIVLCHSLIELENKLGKRQTSSFAPAGDWPKCFSAFARTKERKREQMNSSADMQ